MSFSKALVRACYRLEDSERYRSVKTAVFDLLENPRARVRPYYDLGMMALVLASVFVLLFSVRHELGAWARILEDFAVSVFVLEYLARLWVHDDAHRTIIEQYERAELINTSFSMPRALFSVLGNKWDYATTPMAVIDLLAIVPSYRPLRFLRIFLLFRLFKLFRYARSVHQFVRVLSEKRVELATLFGFLAFIVLVAASAAYLFESRTEGGRIDSFGEGIYWAVVTLSTVGYGDITPQTTEGRIVTLVLIICGIGVLSFFTSIIVSAFQEKLPEVREQRVFAELERRGDHVILCGYGRIGAAVADRLAADRVRFVVVDPDPERVDLAKRAGYLVVKGQPESIDLLVNLGVEHNASTILCLTGDDVVNAYITLSARQLNAGIRIISRANHDDTVRKLYQAGADNTIQPAHMAALIAGEYVGQPVAFEAIYGVITGQHDIRIETMAIRSGNALEGRRVAEVPLAAMRLILFGIIGLPGRHPSRVETSYRLSEHHFHFNPGSDFVLRDGDIMVLFGHEASVSHFKQQLEAGRL